MKHNFDFEQCSDENPFCVPDGYFEEFNNRIENLIAHRRPSFAERLRLSRKRRAKMPQSFTRRNPSEKIGRASCRERV